MTFTQTENELVITPTTEAQGRQAGAGRRHLRRHDDPADRHRGRALRLGHHARRRDGRERARRRRPPGSRSTTTRPTSRPTRSRSRCPRASSRSRTACPTGPAGHRRRHDDLELGRPRPDGRVPRHGERRRLRGEPVHRRERHADLRRRRPDPPRRTVRRPRADERHARRSSRSLYGPYPFISYGAIVDDDSVGYALETQTRSFFSRNAREGTVAHELAHQWMGDHVSPVPLGGHLAQRGLGDLLDVDVDRAPRRRTRPRQSFDDVMSIPADDPEFWDVVRRRPRPARALPRPRLRPRRRHRCTRCA